MTTETILTHDQIVKLIEQHVYDFDHVRNVEQAVLQSPEMQALRKDSERWRLFIRNYDEYSNVGFIGGWALQAALDAAMEAQT